MKLKELIKIYKQLKGKSGCIVITKDRGGALAVRYGDFIKKHIGLGCIIHPNSSEAKELFNIFPELKESEDERIRKALIKYYSFDKDGGSHALDNITPKQIVTWLEKQGKNNIGISEATKQELEDNLNKALEKETPDSWNKFLDEQKPADKIEPKFKVGDWVVRDGKTLQISGIDTVLDGTFHYWFTKGTWLSSKKMENAMLWTIQDAKAGDVLCNYCEEYDNPLIFILKKFERVDFGLAKPSDYSSYCFLTAGDRQIFKEGKYHHKHNIKPATREQRELLFQKMKEDGYVWDAEKKELKKIEPKTTDKKGMNLVEEKMTPFQKKVFCIIDTTIEEEQGLKQVCDELLALAKQDEQKPAWSEEDEKILNLIIARLHSHPNVEAEEYGKDYHWLKSIKPQSTWKPSDEQMEALKGLLGLINQKSMHGRELVSLIEQLKKLREE